VRDSIYSRLATASKIVFVLFLRLEGVRSSFCCRSYRESGQLATVDWLALDAAGAADDEPVTPSEACRL